MIVAKFGGTSVKDPTALRQCLKVLRLDKKRKVCVLSASAGTTNQLKKIADKVNDSSELVEQIITDHRNYYQEILEVEEVLSIEKIFSDLRKNFTQYNEDKLLSFGEILSTNIFYQYCKKEGVKAHLFFAPDLIRTSGGQPDFEVIETLGADELRPLTYDYDLIITQGFIASDEQGNLVTLGRGGSDYSASLFASAINADKLEIWTDVTGVKSCDPRLVKDAREVNELNFKEAAELANFGAKVIHPLTLGPTGRKDIPVFIGSTFFPENIGTLISSRPKDKRAVKVIARRDFQTLLTLTSLKMIGAPGFLAKVFDCLREYNLSVDLVTTSEANVAITLDGNNNGYGEQLVLDSALLRKLKTFCRVKVEHGLSLIALVGSNPSESFHYNRSQGHDLDIRLFCQGASKHNVCFLVPQKSVDKDIVSLHHDFFDQQNLGIEN
jgi:aspartate kinase